MMQSTATVHMGIILVFSVLCSGCASIEEPSNMTQQDLINLLSDFGSRNKLDSYAVESMLADVTWSAERIGGGGVGTINNSLFVSLDSRRNTIFVNDNKWIGRASTENEIVIVTDGVVVKDFESANVDLSILVLFTPTSIRYFDFSNKLAGKYTRE